MSALQVGFVRERVKEIRSALFFHEGSTAFIFPAAIISALDLDNDGNIRFFLMRPCGHILEEDLDFPARLDFYRKGKPFFLKVTGMAHLVADGPETEMYISQYGPMQNHVGNALCLVRMKVMHVDYYEPHRRCTDAAPIRILRSLMAWLDQQEPDLHVSGSLALA